VAKDVRLFLLELIHQPFFRGVDVELSSALKTIALFQEQAQKPIVVSYVMNFERNPGSLKFILKAFTCVLFLLLSRWHTSLVAVC
jgi:hypothetical protein